MTAADHCVRGDVVPATGQECSPIAPNPSHVARKMSRGIGRRLRSIYGCGLNPFFSESLQIAQGRDNGAAPAYHVSDGLWTRVTTDGDLLSDSLRYDGVIPQTATPASSVSATRCPAPWSSPVLRCSGRGPAVDGGRLRYRGSTWRRVRSSQPGAG